MILVGGPYSGKNIPFNRGDRGFVMPDYENPRISDFRIEDVVKMPSFNVHQYRYERVELAWGESCSFECVACVHESITDKDHVRVAVLSAFMGEMLRMAAKVVEGGK